MASPLTLVRDNPLTLQAGATATITAAGNLDVADTDYSDAQLVYTVVSGPSDGVLLDSGVASSTFTQADLDNGLVSYRETASYPQNANTFPDQFVFNVSDPSGNQLGDTTFQIGIEHSYPVSVSAPDSLTVFAGLATAITGVQIAYGGYSNEQFTAAISSNTGTLSLSNNAGATVSGLGTTRVTITGTLAQLNSALDSLFYTGAAAGSDAIVISTTDLGDQNKVSETTNIVVRQASSFSTIATPAATSPPYDYGINNEGQIVGGSLAVTHYNATGEGQLVESGLLTTGINNAGVTVGYGFDETTNRTSYFSFVSDPNISYSPPSNSDVYFEDINDQDEIVGYQVGIDGNTLTTAFILQNGVFYDFGPAGAVPYGINNGGQVVGDYNSEGFIYSNGVFSTLPNFPNSRQTDVQGINNAGVIVGYYEDSQGAWHGFSYDQGNGTWTAINVPDATATYVYGINDSDQVAGYYLDQDGDPHSFTGTIPTTFPSVAGNNDEWILADGQWEASAQPGSHPSGYQVAGVGDFTGNGTDGILWYDAATGDVDEWKISDGGWAGSIDLGTHPGSYQIAGVGDFTGNGTDDVLWTSVSGNGQVQTDIWELSNGQWAASVSPGPHPAGYQVAGIGDWTGNGTDGVLWYDATTGDVDEWQLLNGQWAKSVDLGVHPGNYQIAGVGDFFGNGIDDILWTSVSGNGQIQADIWELGSNGQWIDSVQPGPHPAGYQVVGIGDFTGNGTSDILWQNPTTGDVDEWLINNGQWAGSIDLGAHPGNYQIAGIGDFTGSGTSGILWHSNT